MSSHQFFAPFDIIFARVNPSALYDLAPFGVSAPINDSMPPSQKADIMCRLSSAIRSIGHLPDHTKLHCLGLYSNSLDVVEGIVRDFFWHATYDVSLHPTILRFYDSAGNIITNACTAANLLMLKPLQDGASENCRPDDVSFVQLSTRATSPLASIHASLPTAQTTPSFSTSA